MWQNDKQRDTNTALHAFLTNCEKNLWEWIENLWQAELCEKNLWDWIEDFRQAGVFEKNFGVDLNAKFSKWQSSVRRIFGSGFENL